MQRELTIRLHDARSNQDFAQLFAELAHDFSASEELERVVRAVTVLRAAVAAHCTAWQPEHRLLLAIQVQVKGGQVAVCREVAAFIGYALDGRNSSASTPATH